MTGGLHLGQRVWLDGRPGKVVGFNLSDDLYVDIDLDCGRQTFARAGGPRLATKAPIVTVHEYPPIPDRRWDWCAYREGDEEGGNRGWGRTREEAVADLLLVEDDG